MTAEQARKVATGDPLEAFLDRVLVEVEKSAKRKVLFLEFPLKSEEIPLAEGVVGTLHRLGFAAGVFDHQLEVEW